MVHELEVGIHARPITSQVNTMKHVVERIVTTNRVGMESQEHNIL